MMINLKGDWIRRQSWRDTVSVVISKEMTMNMQDAHVISL